MKRGTSFSCTASSTHPEFHRRITPLRRTVILPPPGKLKVFLQIQAIPRYNLYRTNVLQRNIFKIFVITIFLLLYSQQFPSYIAYTHTHTHTQIPRALRRHGILDCHKLTVPSSLLAANHPPAGLHPMPVMEFPCA